MLSRYKYTVSIHPKRQASEASAETYERRIMNMKRIRIRMKPVKVSVQVRPGGRTAVIKTTTGNVTREKRIPLN